MTKLFLDTPKDWWALLDEEFNFTLDAAASDENHLCDIYFTKEDDALQQDWDGHTVWCSGVWTDPECYEWVKKAYIESRTAVVVMLLPVRTNADWWHEFVCESESIRFLTGKLNFAVPPGIFAYHVEEHCIVVFERGSNEPPWISSYPHQVIQESSS